MNCSTRQNLSPTILLALSLLIGLLTFRDYGESWDELKLYDYASDSLRAYVTWSQHGTIPVTGDRFENYGPAFMMFTTLLKKVGKQIFPSLQTVDIQHLLKRIFRRDVIPAEGNHRSDRLAIWADHIREGHAGIEMDIDVGHSRQKLDCSGQLVVES